MYVKAGNGATYLITFIDDFSRYSLVFMLSHHYEAFHHFKWFVAEVENQKKGVLRLFALIEVESIALISLENFVRTKVYVDS